MSPVFQSIVTLAIVAVTATWLVFRAFAKRKNPGCGGDCACPASDIKLKGKSSLGHPPA